MGYPSHNFVKKNVLCEKGDETTRFDGTLLIRAYTDSIVLAKITYVLRLLGQNPRVKTSVVEIFKIKCFSLY
jgi:hypothetical protein